MGWHLLLGRQRVKTIGEFFLVDFSMDSRIDLKGLVSKLEETGRKFKANSKRNFRLNKTFEGDEYHEMQLPPILPQPA